MRLTTIGLAGIAASLLALPAFAHHTHAMFDFTRTVELNATVKDFKWTNPHSWLHVTAPNAQGQVVEFTIEMSSPSGLVQRGWTPTTVTPGDKIVLTIYPTKGGGNGGTLKEVKLADGKALGHEND
jgi:hypothetical protein